MNDQLKIDKYADEVLAEKEKLKLSDEDFCIIIYARSVPQNHRKWVKHIYKTVEDFKVKALADINKIDDMYAVDFEMWVFD